MLPQKILCSTDFSEPSYAALKTAEELALHFSADLVIVHVVLPIPTTQVLPTGAPSHFNIAMYEKQLQESAEQSLDKVIHEKVSDKVRVHPVVTLGQAADRIVETAKDEQIDLIVMATHGRTGWRHFVFGSVAERVLRLAPCPVLTVHAPRENREA